MSKVPSSLAQMRAFHIFLFPWCALSLTTAVFVDRIEAMVEVMDRAFDSSIEPSPFMAIEVKAESKDDHVPSTKGPRFWLVFLGLCLAGFISSTDSTVIFTILPTIT